MIVCFGVDMSIDQQQTDWVGYSEFPESAEMDTCPVCNAIILNLHISAGRPSVYCSDACKMKAYRQRNKALRNSKPVLTDYYQRLSTLSPLQRLIAIHNWTPSDYSHDKQEALRKGIYYVSCDGLTWSKGELS
jgi:hypothetical protein